MTGPLFPMHLALMIAAFVAFAVGFVTALIFLFQERALKSHRPAVVGWRLPSIEAIDAVHYRILAVGFVLFSLGMLVGAALSKGQMGRFFVWDPREIGAIAMWALYAVFLNIRLKAGWRGRRGILLSILGFAGVMLAFLALNHRGM